MGIRFGMLGSHHRPYYVPDGEVEEPFGDTVRIAPDNRSFAIPISMSPLVGS
jgi:hypothetical protein